MNLPKNVEARFDAKFPYAWVQFKDDGSSLDKMQEVKAFLAQELQLQKENIPVGFLRQWLNEDRITDKPMVTDEDLRAFIRIGYNTPTPSTGETLSTNSKGTITEPNT